MTMWKMDFHKKKSTMGHKATKQDTLVVFSRGDGRPVKKSKAHVIDFQVDRSPNVGGGFGPKSHTV